MKSIFTDDLVELLEYRILTDSDVSNSYIITSADVKSNILTVAGEKGCLPLVFPSVEHAEFFLRHIYPHLLSLVEMQPLKTASIVIGPAYIFTLDSVCQYRCSDCVCLVEKYGIAICDECDKPIAAVDRCPEGLTIPKIMRGVNFYPWKGENSNEIC